MKSQAEQIDTWSGWWAGALLKEIEADKKLLKMALPSWDADTSITSFLNAVGLGESGSLESGSGWK